MTHIQGIVLHYGMQNDCYEDVKEDGDQVLQPIAIVNELAICGERERERGVSTAAPQHIHNPLSLITEPAKTGQVRG